MNRRRIAALAGSATLVVAGVTLTACGGSSTPEDTVQSTQVTEDGDLEETDPQPDIEE